MKIEIRPEAFYPLQEQGHYQQDALESGKYGATASFIGSMRDFNEGDEVTGMELEYYPGMTEKHLQMICDEACQWWAITDILLLHRVGKIEIGDPIVLVCVWTSHRGDAFDACRFIMEDLKSKAPFWKKEQLVDGQRWVDCNTSGYSQKND